MTLPASGVVYVDAQIIIYTVEQHPRWSPLLAPFWTTVMSGGAKVVSSELTMLEALVFPLRSGQRPLVDAYDQFFARPVIEWVPVTRGVLRAAAELRAGIPRLKTPDAVHLASARANGCTTFFTNDADLAKLSSIPTTLLSQAPP